MENAKPIAACLVRILPIYSPILYAAILFGTHDPRLIDYLLYKINCYTDWKKEKDRRIKTDLSYRTTVMLCFGSNALLCSIKNVL